MDDYVRTGWTAFAKFLEPTETARLREYTHELTEFPEMAGAHMVYREKSLLDDSRVIQRIEDFCPYHAGFDALLRRGRLAAVAEELLGEPAVLFKDKINFKAPGGAGFEAHQDQQAGWSKYAPLFLTAMVAIDAANEENGCLQIAESARLTRLLGEEWKPLHEEQCRNLQFVALPMNPGDVAFFDSYVVHRSFANLTPYGRRVLYITFNRSADGDHRRQYFADKRQSFPPDIERQPGVTYRFRV